MAIVSFDAATAGGGAIAAVKRMAQHASDRWKDDFISEKGVSQLGRVRRETQDDQKTSTCRYPETTTDGGTFKYS
jgi:hypothetical protein